MARGWSESSHDEARHHAEQRLAKILAALQSGDELVRYQYVADDVICEEVIDRTFNGDEEMAVISRNIYGSIVMNTPRMIFVDIDVKQPGTLNKLTHWLLRSKQVSPEEQTLENIRQWQASHPEYSLRVYRTHAGFRLIVSNRAVQGVDDETIRILDELQSDRLYRRLCLQQSCFRARLSPKPWRVGATRPPVLFPYPNEQAEGEFHRWFEHYVTLCKSYSVCHFIETLGDETPFPTIAPLIAQHDSFCCGNLPLA